MVDEVPHSVKEYWANNLTSMTRRWTTDLFIEVKLIDKEVVTVDGAIDYELADEWAAKIKADDILKAFDAVSSRPFWG
jgi:hypothetical protein